MQWKIATETEHGLTSAFHRLLALGVWGVEGHRQGVGTRFLGAGREINLEEGSARQSGHRDSNIIYIKDLCQDG